MKKNDDKVNFDDKNKVIICKNCGDSIDISSSECEYCGSIIPKNNEWIITSVEEFC